MKREGTRATNGVLPLSGADELVDLDQRVEPDPRLRRYVMPARIVWTTSESQGRVENATALLERRAGQVTIPARNPSVLHGGAGILLDFGRELHGGVQLLVGACGEQTGPTQLRVRFGESASEAMSELGGLTNATNDHAVRDEIHTVSPWSMPEFGPTGFRFVRLDAVTPESRVELKSVRAILVCQEVEYKGSFRCSDKRLNRIWQTGAETVHLCMQHYLWDGIKRDRLVWAGDMHPETATIQTVFGYDDCVPRSLDLVRDETPLPGWMNGISSYSLWWVLVHRDWYWRHGDLDYLQHQETYLAKLLELLLTCIGPDGGERLPPHRFLDWPTSGDEAALHAGLHALLVLGLIAGEELAAALEREDLAVACREGVQRLKRHAPDPGPSKQAAALMALAGLADPADINRRVLAVDGARRLSTFYGYYVLQARALAGDYQGCLDCIREYWGGMLDLGATTFWEHFDLDWTRNAAPIDELVPPGKADIHGDFGDHCYKGLRHSLCHGWASGPTPWLTEHVLGIRVVEPGCRVVRVAPHLGDLEWAEGAFPTPAGTLHVRHEKTPEGTLRVFASPPPGVQVNIAT